MNIEIEGAGFTNKGAELMLRSISHEVRSWGDVRCVVRPSCGSYEQRAELGLWQRADLSRFGRAAKFTRTRVPKSIRERYGLVIPEDVDVVLDASGFRYSDQWGSETAIALAERARNAWSSNIPYILMPQAFGPFENPEGRAAFAQACEHIRLIFARDEDSLEHVRSVIGDDPRLRLAPDFTPWAPPLPTDHDLEAEGVAGLVGVVPNSRMLDKTAGPVASRYHQLMTKAIQEVIEHGYRPILILHSDAADDRELAQEIARSAADEVPVMYERNAQKLKGIIARCDLLIGSRFHALVSALSQGVPSIGTGWSHKYRRLFDDFGCSEALIDVSAPPDRSMEAVRRLLDPNERRRARERLETPNARMDRAIGEMWATIRGAINQNGSR